MITINGRRLCEHCFGIVSEHETRCTHCSGRSNRDKYPTALGEGEVLAGKYITGKVLGKGGFGITYLCYDITKDCRVAIKEYLPDAYSYRATGRKTVSVARIGDEQQYKTGAEKFYDEAKLLSQFAGAEGIVEVKEFFRENNTVYFVMEYLSGVDLKKYLLNKGRMNEDQAVSIAIKVLKSLRILHGRNVLHRDISPDNIFICDTGNVKLIDFGASRISMSGGSQSSLSVILKPGFAPLEQYQSNGNQGAWSDIYALGATLYYALKMKTVNDSVSRLNDEYIDFSGISPKFAAVLEKMLKMRINERFQSADELINLLTAMRNATPTPTPATVSAPTAAPAAGVRPGYWQAPPPMPNPVKNGAAVPKSARKKPPKPMPVPKQNIAGSAPKAKSKLSTPILVILLICLVLGIAVLVMAVFSQFNKPAVSDNTDDFGDDVLVDFINL